MTMNCLTPLESSSCSFLLANLLRGKQFRHRSCLVSSISSLAAEITSLLVEKLTHLATAAFQTNNRQLKMLQFIDPRICKGSPLPRRRRRIPETLLAVCQVFTVGAAVTSRPKTDPSPHCQHMLKGLGTCQVETPSGVRGTGRDNI